ncbi:Allantoinase [Venturia nashicola]|nr:Allantoinase [Venturia nashicola]
MGSRLEKKSTAVRKRIENHTFEDEAGEEYTGSAFGGFTDYFRRKKIKLQNLDAELRSQSDNKPQIFRGVVAHVNGYTQPSLNDLHKLIVQHGGGFLQYLDGKTMVTHIVVSSLTPKKAIEFKRYRIVKPAWVVDSVKAGKLLPWDNYRVLDEGAGQRVIGFDGGKVVNQVSSQVRGYRDQSDASWYTSQLKAANGTPSSSKRPHFLTQEKTPERELEDEIDDEPPPSTQRRLMSQSESYEEDTQESPVPQQTPKLIRDLRSFQEADKEGDDQLPESPTPQNYILESSPRQLGVELEATSETEASQVESFTKLDDGGTVASDEPMMEDDVVQEQAMTEEPPDKDEVRVMEMLKDIDYGSPSKRKNLTLEEHNAILLADPRIRKSTVVHPEFLEQYYRESRLHHLSSWKADLKFQLQAMAEDKSQSQKMREKRPAGARRYILHVDFDSFFAAVSLKQNPHLKEKPVAIAHGGGSGSEIASCNYPARKFGVSNGMWMKRAQELCPDLKVLPYDFPAYEEASRAFYEEIIATGGLVQSVSIDEALVDVSALCFRAAATDGLQRHEGSVYREQAHADAIAQRLRDQVRARTECEVSVGIGGNILIAKVALRKAKPAGQYHVRPEEVLDFVGDLEVTSLPGVAYSIGGKLEAMGIRFVKDIREFTKEKMSNSLGPKTGEKLWEYARGIDRKEVGDVEIRKSVSAEVNWGVRFYNQEQVDEFMDNLCGELEKRLVKERVKGKQLSLKIMRKSKDAPLDPPKHLGHGKCDTFNRSVILGVATNSKDILGREVLSMLKSFGFTPGELRGIGVQMTKLEPLKTGGQVESSQRRLEFKVPEPPRKVPEKQDSVEDPIEEIVTPTKPKALPDRMGLLNQSSPSRKPLNLFGTQFILPSQIDPQVLAELPPDIRSKLAQQMDLKNTKSAGADIAGEMSSTPKVFTALPAESQLDLDILNSLPDDVRAEILGFYKSPKRPRAGEQAVLPQSPRKNRTVNILQGKRPTTTVRRRGRPGRFDVRSLDKNSTLTQTFMGQRRQLDNDVNTATDTDADDTRPKPLMPSKDDLDPEFLAALPKELRLEILDQHRRERLQKASGLQITENRRRRNQPVTNPPPHAQRVFKLPARAPRPTFTTRKISALPELRDAIEQWALEFRDEGPYREDTDALGTYLRRVVVDEGDIAKAVDAVKWLGWLVEEELVEEGDARGGWERAVEVVREVVRDAVKIRGLGKVGFG